MKRLTTPMMIRLQILVTVAVIMLAGADVGRFYEMLIEGWPALSSFLLIMIGGKTYEATRNAKPESGAQ
ncbi:MAG: hypothetical protein ACXW5J_26765 [Thermoanaerobaculia bacterium]